MTSRAENVLIIAAVIFLLSATYLAVFPLCGIDSEIDRGMKQEFLSFATLLFFVGIILSICCVCGWIFKERWKEKNP